MNRLKFLPVILLLFFVGCTMEETNDLAILLEGTYSGKATDEFSSENNKSVVITKISNKEIEIKPDAGNIINSTIRIRIVQDGNWIREESGQVGVSFSAKASKSKTPLTYSTNKPIQSFDGKKSN